MKNQTSQQLQKLNQKLKLNQKEKLKKRVKLNLKVKLKKLKKKKRKKNQKKRRKRKKRRRKKKSKKEKQEENGSDEKKEEKEEKDNEEKKEKEDKEDKDGTDPKFDGFSTKFTGPPAIISHTDYSKPPDNWVTLDDEFFFFLAANMPWLSADLKAAPRSLFADGSIDLVMSRAGFGKLNRSEALKLFGLLETGEHVNHKLIEYHKVKAFVLEPGPETSKSSKKKEGNLMIDGERIPYLPTAVENYQGMMNVICAPPTTRSSKTPSSNESIGNQ